jgi:methylase of polypeptide subunit release factors
MKKKQPETGDRRPETGDRGSSGPEFSLRKISGLRSPVSGFRSPVFVRDEHPGTLTRAQRRARGAFYTPPWLVDEVVGEALAGPLARARWREGAPELRVLDPAAGDGRFLAACAERIADAAAARGLPREAARRAAVARVVVGVERDPAAAARARAALGPDADVRVAEALLGAAVEEGAWDVVVGNPPYLRSVALKRDEPELWRRLRGAFAATSYREWDLYAAFLEKTLAWLAPGGEAGLVTPSRWLTAAFAAPLRARLAPAVREIVDLGARQIFDGATTYIALTYLARRPLGAVAVEKGGARGSVARARLGAAPWPLAVGAAAAELERLAALGPPLGAVARIAKGAGTNADPVFLLEERDGRLWSPALGEPVEVERSLCVPCLRGRDISAFAATPRRWALLPYRGDRLIPFAELPPGAAAYLGRCRALLEAREGGRFAGDGFHRWGRPQNLAWLLDPAPKVVIPDAARAGRAALDAAGTLVIDTAYAVRPTDPSVSIELLLRLLNSGVVATWLGALGIPLRGGYFRMKTEYLRSLPVVPDP